MKWARILAGLLAAAPAVAAGADAGGAWAIVEGPSGPVKASLFSDEHATLPVARVESSVITLRDLSDALAAAHQAHSPGSTTGGNKDFTPVLNRLIGVRLIFLEAHDIGLDQLPDVQQEMAAFQEVSLREALKAEVTRQVKPDPKEVAAHYRESVREWKVRSLLFEKEADARALAASAKAGRKYEGLAKAAVAARKAKSGDLQLVSAKLRALPAVLEAVKPLAPGGTSGAVRLEKGFAVLHVEAVAYPDDAQKKQEAEDWSLARQRTVELMKFYQAVQAKTVHRDDKLISSLDFEAKQPGFAALLKDARVLARVEGGKSITVADLAQAIDQDFFHGIDRAIQEKKVNPRRIGVFNDLLYREVFGAEARRRHLEQSPAYLKTVHDRRDALVFSKFIEKAVMPEVRVTEGDLMKFYEDHKADYTYPAFYTLSSIAFPGQKAAQAAFDQLKTGTDFRWLRSNAPGQLDEARRALEFDGSTVSAKSMPSDLAKLLSGTKAGDLRFYASPEGGFYVLQVKAVTQPKAQPYPEAREDVLPKVQREMVTRKVEEWIAKLRKARQVKVYISQIVS